MSTSAERSPFFQVFRHRNYALFMIGLGPHAISTWMHRVAVGWLAWELTHSTAWLGIIAAADLAPLLILSPIAGAVVDRMVPLHVLRLTQWAQFVMAALLAGLMYAGLVNIWILFVIMLVLGCVHAFGAASRHATVPYTVPRQLVATAVSLDSALFQASRFIGPAIAAIGLQFYGVLSLLVAHTVGTFVFSLFMHLMDVPAPERRAGRSSMLANIKEGIRYVHEFRAMGLLFLLCGFGAVFLRPVQEMLPGFAGAVYSAGPTGLAWLTSAMGIGAMVSATWIGVRGRIQGLTNICYAGSALLAVATIGFVVTNNLYIGVVFAILSGFALNTVTTGIQALVQSAVDDSMRGRVMSLFTVIFRGTPAIGGFALGVLAEFIGLRWTFAIAALICVAALVWLLPQRRSIRDSIEQERREHAHDRH
jgi:MFS family permease